MSFQFRYQRVLEVKETQEDREKAEFGRIQQRLSEEREKLDKLQDKMRQMFDRLRQRREGKQNVQGFLQAQNWAGVLEEKIERQQQVVEKWEEKLENQREQLVEASRERRVFEQLKESDFEEFQEEVRRERLKQNNEIANRQHYQEHREGAE